MNRLFAFVSCATMAGCLTWTAAPLSGQSKTTAPIPSLTKPLGSTSALAGQFKPLGGTGGRTYASGHQGGGHYGHGNGRGPGVYGFATYVPGYWDYLGDPVGGPYSYTWPSYGELAPPEPPPAPTPAAPPGSAPPPQVIINNYYGYPPPPGVEPGGSQAEGVVRPGDPLGQPQNYYLIVYKDHSIHAALAYWVEGGALHYVTTDNAHNQVSLDLVDVEASTKLNSDHSVPFSIAGK